MFIASRSNYRGTATNKRDSSAPNQHRRQFPPHESVRSESSNRYPSRNPGFQNETDGDQRNRSKKPVRQMGFNMIQKLLENNDLEDIVFQMNNDRKGFKELLEDRVMKADIIVLVMKLLAKICGCSFKHSIITLLETALRSSFADNAVNYISKLAIQVSSFYK